ncbi:acetylcholinesterase-1 [Caerostris extrusa]|uniref:Carboxylic ester hydrolase n=1 Tax=Caerostris extrusa TaxID=172846 RepID=A0AAV4P3T7_CAEEX|nr:acetylcholinesterase-1 [Caerostris extrusa]
MPSICRLHATNIQRIHTHGTSVPHIKVRIACILISGRLAVPVPKIPRLSCTGYMVEGTGMALYNRNCTWECLLAALGDIIVVTVNYRLGPFGFLTSGTDDAPGNAGIWDLLEGLKWVNRNIEFFGGDPQRVTLAGESAGSIAVGLLRCLAADQRSFQKADHAERSAYSLEGRKQHAEYRPFPTAIKDRRLCQRGIHHPRQS